MKTKNITPNKKNSNENEDLVEPLTTSNKMDGKKQRFKKPKKNNKFKRPLDESSDSYPSAKKAKTKVKEDIEKSDIVPLTRKSDDPLPLPKIKWTNKQRVLVFSSRGILNRHRYLMKNLRTLLPHSRAEPKMDKKDPLYVINEICETRNCNKCLYFEKKRHDLYLWASNVPNGPSVKFLVENIDTMEEFKLTGNCLKGSRPLLSFDKNFKEKPQYALVKEIFTQIFGTPRGHPHSKPFIDHVMTFTVLDNRIWFRNYQILEEGGTLSEIGPRMTLHLIKIFDGSFGGPTLFLNMSYVTPSVRRRLIKQQRMIEQNNAKENSSDSDDSSEEEE